MSRPIKFRGWHTELKKMFSPEELAADQLTLLTTGRFINVSGDFPQNSIIYSLDKFIPLQFTGLLDKTGKEIFEGDIVAQYDWKGIADNSVIKWFQPRCGFWIFKGAEAHLELGDYRNNLLVIGNLYENPGLLP